MSRIQRVQNESQSCFSLLNLIPRVNCLAAKISGFITETLLCQKIVLSARTFILIMHVGKMDCCSCAVVLERSCGSLRSFQNSRSIQTLATLRPKKGFLKTLEDGIRVKREKIRATRMWYFMMCSNRTTRCKNKQTIVSETDFISWISSF